MTRKGVLCQWYGASQKERLQPFEYKKGRVKARPFQVEGGDCSRDGAVS